MSRRRLTATEVDFDVVRQRALLVGTGIGTRDVEAAEASLDELALLVDTAGADPVELVLQRRDTPDPATYIGSGKAKELQELAVELDVDLVVFDDELTPAQQRNLEKLFSVDVVDRVALILDIFAQHARSQEGMVQVELAQLRYRLPRLAGRGKQLSQQGAGGGARGGLVGNRGPGETQLEVDRRRIQTRIARLERELDRLAKNRDTQRKSRRRSARSTVALVGYTNAGKSTLLNRLTDAEVLVEDRLFSTLDPTTRRLRLPGGETVLASDTVGFVQRLPHQLVESFQSTLEEVVDADLLLHIVDTSSPDALHQIEAVHSVLHDIGAGQVPELVVLNKADIATPGDVKALRVVHSGAVTVSAVTGEGVSVLLDTLAARLRTLAPIVELLVPYERGDVVAALHREGEVLVEVHAEGGSRVRARLPAPAVKYFEEFVVNTRRVTAEHPGFAGDRVLDALDVSVVVYGRDGRRVFVNRLARHGIDLLGTAVVEDGEFGDVELIDEHGRVITPDERPWFRTLSTGEAIENCVLGARSRKHAGLVWLTVTTQPLLDDGEVSGAVCSISDITEMRNAQAALQDSEERFRILAENAADVVYSFTVGDDPQFDYVNPAVEPALGYTPEEFYADPGLILRVTDDDDAAQVRELGSTGVEEVRSVQLRMMRRDGTMIWTEHRVVPLRDAEGTITGITGITRDVTALKIKEAYLSHRALHDPLTGLPNRVLLLDRIEAALARLRRHRSHLAVLYLDLDRFKTVNDNLGHEIGDRLLNVVARRLQDTLRPSDSVARLGGDEFAALLPDLNDPSEAAQVAERLLAAIAEPVELADGALVTTVSIGVAAAADGDTSAGELLRRADFAMYMAKDRGRARVESYDADASAGSTGAAPSE